MNSLREQDRLIDSPLDINELSARCLGRLDLVDKVLRRFHEAMDQELDQLEQALRATNVTTIAAIAHRIKGTSLTVAAHGLRDCAEQLEAALQSDCFPGIEECVAVIHQEWSRLSDMISTHSPRTDQ